MKYQIDRKVRRTRNDIRRWIRLRRNQHKLAFGVMGLIIACLFFGLVFSIDHSSELKYQRKVDHQNFIKTRTSLQKRLETVEKQKAETDAQLQQKAATEADLHKQIDDLNKQLQSKRESLASRVINTVTFTQTAYAAPANCAIWHSGIAAADTLINRESGGRTCALNAGGCFGILQACPGYPLQAACGNDGACQFAWFTTNKLGRYGSWDAALAHSYQFNWW